MSYKKKGLKKPTHKKRKKKKGNNATFSGKVIGSNDKFFSTLEEYVSDKPRIINDIHLQIEKVIDYFKSYDRIQLLGGIGLKLIKNLPTPDIMIDTQRRGDVNMDIDDVAEAIMEYAMNFGTAMPNMSLNAPTEDVLDDLYNTLKELSHLHNLYDMPISKSDSEAWLIWMVHMDHIYVRGDGYASIVEEVFNELFFPHNDYFKQKFGFSFNTLKSFCTKIERFILSKIATPYGANLAYERWKEDSERQYGTGEEAIEKMIQDKPENGVMGRFIDRSPDLFRDDPTHLVLYQPNDFGSSDRIFWVVPQDKEESNLYEKLSRGLGDNSSFLAEGDFKGNILSGMELYKKPLVKVDEKYFCFTPMIPHRNMISLAESLLKEDHKYYESHYRNNTDPISRDKYMER